MNKRTISVSILLIVGLLTITACGAMGLSAVTNSNSPAAQGTALPTLTAVVPSTGSVPVPSGASGDLLAAYQGTLEQIYASVNPSVVNIQVVEKVAASDNSQSQIPGFPFFNQPQGQQPQQQFQSALGSGFVWDAQGHIVTNNHVVAGADSIEVTFSDGTIVPAKLVGTDPDSDLAVIKVEVDGSVLHPVTMSDSSTVQVGQMAIAIGNPFGLQGTMTSGIISGLARTLPTDQSGATSYTIPDIIQTDAPINPGNSGGVLLDAQGQVVGVTAAIESPVRASAGVGFAIPSNIVNNVVPVLIKEGKYVHPWIGISGASLVPELAKAMNLDPGQRGALVEEVLPNSPAEKADLRPSNQQVTIQGLPATVGGDVITAIDGQPVRSMDDVIAYLARSTKVDQKVTLNILRDGKEMSVEVTLSARPSAEERAQQNNNQQQTPVSGVTLGIAGTSVDDSIAQEMKLPSGTQGVLVEQVQPGSLAEQAGLQGGSKTVTVNGQQLLIGGDIITAVDSHPVTGIDDLKAALSQFPAGHPFTLTVLRDGTETQIQVQPGQ
jgi:S1-C subfamily serine protease